MPGIGLDWISTAVHGQALGVIDHMYGGSRCRIDVYADGLVPWHHDSRVMKLASTCATAPVHSLEQTFRAERTGEIG
jgi:hypothetical protein